MSLRLAERLIAQAGDALRAAGEGDHPAVASYRTAIADAQADAEQLGRRVARLRKMMNAAAATGPVPRRRSQPTSTRRGP